MFLILGITILIGIHESPQQYKEPIPLAKPPLYDKLRIKQRDSADGIPQSQLLSFICNSSGRNLFSIFGSKIRPFLPEKRSLYLHSPVFWGVQMD